MSDEACFFGVVLLVFLGWALVVFFLWLGGESQAWFEKWANPPQANLRREQKRKQKLSAELAKVNKKIEREVEQLKKLQEAEQYLSELKNPVHVVNWLNSFCGRSRVLEANLLLQWRSPLRIWMKRWTAYFPGGLGTEPQWSMTRGRSGCEAADTYELACKLQREEWEASREKHLAKVRPLQQRVNELSKELDIKAKDWLSGFEQASVAQEEPARVRVPEELLTEKARLLSELELVEEAIRSHKAGDPYRGTSVPTRVELDEADEIEESGSYESELEEDEESDGAHEAAQEA